MWGNLQLPVALSVTGSPSSAIERPNCDGSWASRRYTPSWNQATPEPMEYFASPGIRGSGTFLTKNRLGDGQKMVYLPLGLLGFIVMSYLGSVAERSKRGLYLSISWSDTRTFLA